MIISRETYFRLSSIEKCETFVRTFFRGRVSFDGMPLPVAMAVSLEFYNVVMEYPKLLEYKPINFFGTYRGILNGIKNDFDVLKNRKEFVEYINNKNEQSYNDYLGYFKKNYTKNDVIRKLYKARALYELGNPGVLRQVNTSHYIFESEFLIQRPRISRRSGIILWPTCDLHTATHECGHWLDDLLKISSSIPIKNIYRNSSRKDMTEKLSWYAWCSYDGRHHSTACEMVAEGFSYKFRPSDHTPYSKIICDIIDKMYTDYVRTN